MLNPLKRLVAIDTETTGFSNSDKIVEIACIEIIDGETGSSFHRWVNPTIGIPDRAFDVHGLSNEFLGCFFGPRNGQQIHQKRATSRIEQRIGNCLSMKLSCTLSEYPSGTCCPSVRCVCVCVCDGFAKLLLCIQRHRRPICISNTYIVVFTMCLAI